VKRTLLLGALSAANIAGFAFFQLAVVSHFGPGDISDAFFASLTLPQLFMAIVGGALNSALVPMFSGEAKSKQNQDAWTLIVALGAGLLVVACIAAATAQFWVPWLVPGFSAAALAQTIVFSRVSVFTLALTAINFVQAALAQARGQVVALECALALPTLLATLAVVILLPKYGVGCVMWAFVLRPVLQCIAMVVLHQKPTAIDFQSGVLRETWKRVRPILLASGYYKLDPVVDRALMSWAVPGSMSMLLIVQQVHSACSQVLAKMLVSPVFGPMAEDFKQGRLAQFWARFNKLIKSTLLLAITVAFAIPIAIAILTAVSGQPIPGFSGRAGELLVLFALSAGMLVVGALGAVTTTAFFARHQPGHLAKLASSAFTIGALVKILLFYMFGIQGLAFGVSCYFTLSFLLQWRALTRMQATDGVSP
jgi:putative peptidoglycan lipid II flippase